MANPSQTDPYQASFEKTQSDGESATPSSDQVISPFFPPPPDGAKSEQLIPSLLEGKRITATGGNRYLVGKRSAEGGMSYIYKAHMGGQVFALKVLKDPFVAGSPIISKQSVPWRFLREARLMQGLHSEYLVSFVDEIRQWPTIGIVFEWMDQGDLEGWLLEKNPPISNEILWSILSPLLESLKVLHEKGVIHRDFKPGNALLKSNASDRVFPYHVKLGDLGIARLMDSEEKTRHGVTLGTPEYMSPEQLLGGELSGACDIYAFGVLLYRLLEGRKPFSLSEGEPMTALALRVLGSEIPSLGPETPQPLKSITLKCLAREPKDRYRDIESLRRDLFDALFPSIWRRAWRWFRR